MTDEKRGGIENGKCPNCGDTMMGSFHWVDREYVCAPAPPARMPDEEFEAMLRRLDDGVSYRGALVDVVCVVAEARRAREGEAAWRDHYTDLACLLNERDAEIAGLRETLDGVDAHRLTVQEGLDNVTRLLQAAEAEIAALRILIAALRAELAERDRERGLAGAWEARAKTAEADRDRLAKIIDEAPHALNCHLGYCRRHAESSGMEEFHCANRAELKQDCDADLLCDCWKARAALKERL